MSDVIHEILDINAFKKLNIKDQWLLCRQLFEENMKLKEYIYKIDQMKIEEKKYQMQINEEVKINEENSKIFKQCENIDSCGAPLFPCNGCRQKAICSECRKVYSLCSCGERK